MSRYSSKTTLDAIKHFRDAPTRDPMLGWYWRIEELPDFGSIIMPPEYAESITLPLPKLDAGRTSYVGSSEITFPGQTSVDSFSLLLYEDVKLRAMEWVQAWQANIQNPYTGGYYLPTRYKKEIPVSLLNNAGEVAATCLLRGCWPSVVQNWELTSGGDEKLVVGIDMICDVSQLIIGSN